MGPAFWVVSVLLVINDWGLKPLGHLSVVTGKASDVTGLFLLSALLVGIISTPDAEHASPLRSLLIAFSVIAIFTSAKTTELGYEVVSHTWGYFLAPLRYLTGEWSTAPIDMVADASDVGMVPAAFCGAWYVRSRWRSAK